MINPFVLFYKNIGMQSITYVAMNYNGLKTRKESKLEDVDLP